MINKLSNIDMKDLYRELLCNYEEFPEILVFEELEDKSNICCHLMPNGRYLYYLKNDNSMIKVLFDQLNNPCCNTKKAQPFEYHRMEGEDIAKWIACACKIADILDIRCPQIMFMYGEDAGNFNGEGILVLPDTLDDLEMFVCLAHELRHEWQHKNHPEWNEDYIQVESEDDIESYRNHKTEIDAEAFGIKLAAIIFEAESFKNKDTEYLSKLANRADEINIDLSQDDIVYLQAWLFDDDDEDEENE